MNEQENYDALFNPETEINEQPTGNLEEFKPTAAKGKNNVYQAIIRFIPWWKNPKHGSMPDKWTCWLVDPITDRGRYVDCPSSVGKQSSLSDIYWKLKKSDSVALQKKADIFSRRHSFSSLIQVIKDENNSEYEGKIMVWRYGVKIQEKINAELKPVIGDKHDPFDIVTGKVFALVITKVSGYNNYDQSKFVDKRIPLCIPNADGKLIPIKPSDDKQKIFEWVKENSPNLEKYVYKEWDNETLEYVNHVITAVTGQASVAPNYASVKNTRDDGGGDIIPLASNDGSGITSTELNIEDIDTGISSESVLPDLDLPELPEIGEGIVGDLSDALKDL